MERILHILWSGEIGGIEKLCLNIGKESPKKHIFWFVNRGGQVYEEMCREGIKTRLLNASNFQIIKVLDEILEVVDKKEIRAIIIHHDSVMLWIIALMLKRRNKHIKVFIYAHSDYSYFIPEKGMKKIIYERLFKKNALFSDGIIAISESVKDSIVKKGNIASNKIKVIYNGVPLQNFKYYERKNDKNRLNIVYVGRLLEEKGIQILINALCEKYEECEVSCTIVGDGVYSEKLKELVNYKKMDKNVKFVGSQMDVYGYLKEADVFVHPAICDEGFGITLVEAMSTGLPCIAFNKGAIPELISNNVNGIIVEETSAMALHEAIGKIIEFKKNGSIKKMRDEATEKAQLFSCNKMVDTLQKYVFGE